MIYVEQLAAFEAAYSTGETGLIPGLEYAIVDNDGAVVLGPTSANLAETEVGGNPTGNYVANVAAAPGDVGQYQILWSRDGTFDPNTVDSEELIVVAAGITVTVPPIVPDTGDGPSAGPCTAWTTSEDAAACCDAANVGTNTALMDAAVVAASDLLYAASGRAFPGECSGTFRPCSQSLGCGVQVLSRGHVVGWSGRYWNGYHCGCAPLQAIELAGYPVREILEVKIDGAVVAPTGYRLDGWRYLVRTRAAPDDPVEAWPACQALDLEDDEVGTFSVRYSYGAAVPLEGSNAANELACEIYLGCSTDECSLPKGTIQVTRQGLTVDLAGFRAWGRREGVWQTGLPLVDLFLNAHNPTGRTVQPLFMSPDAPRFPTQVG